MNGTHVFSTSPAACQHLPVKKRRVRWMHKLFRHVKLAPRPHTPDQPPEKSRYEPSEKSAPLDFAYPLENDQEYKEFLHQYPEYRLTHPVDALRKSDFSRLERSGETYVDYMGGALYPESLITKHADFLKDAVLGNTHSINNSSQASSKCASEARSAVLAFFQASSEYTVIFTMNASGALKLVGESYPFSGDNAFVLAVDSHNSVNGIREFAFAKGSHCAYIPSTPTGGFDSAIAEAILLKNKPKDLYAAPSLFALTGQSNISNWKAPLGITAYASSLGYHVLLDAAALAPSTSFSLSDYPAIDAIAVSFYKMFGFPTGIGALVAKKKFLGRLKRPWFAGGTVDVVQVPGKGFTRAEHLYEQFEDGTINYTMLPSITEGLRFLSTYLPYLPLRLSCLLDYLISSLSRLQHDVSGKPVVQFLSRRPNPAERVSISRRTIGSRIARLAPFPGCTFEFCFVEPSGNLLPNAFIEYAASVNCVSLRTGCVCNAARTNISGEVEQMLGRDTGVVRISLGLASDFEDVRRVVQFASLHRIIEG
ncbi:PLP-dependent transferase [Coprinellus micaceus]|uniref:PLP-dependent transferase n=1 Tax=Coprinellus micaceus TaxID=71717 RepID=A0A4Y7SZP3_COPMI|nr:PLP-dependent transferase [Coprinellus micaceus]